MISLAGLNPEQREAAQTIDGPLLILAGAGSGKTRTVTYRIAHMIDNLKIPAHSILAVSFTNKAATEMRERVNTLLGRGKTKGLTLSTFHSLGVRILRNEIHRLGMLSAFTIYDTSDQLSIIREALKNYHADKTNYDRKLILAQIGKLKNQGIGPNDYAHTPYFDPHDPYHVVTEYVYHFYQDKLKFYNAIDFDDILFLTVKIFEQFPEAAKFYSEKYRYLMVDEYQDTNLLQIKMIEGLTSQHKNICVVGDDDQSIYAFRGADITNILSFERIFEGAKVIKLEENYRSTKPIISLANMVIRENKKRKDKTMRTSNQSDVLPLLWATGDSDHEAAVIADEINKHQAEGLHLADVAILYRSNNQTGPLEDQLRLAQIPYTILGGQKFYEKKEIKDLVAYLSVLHNPQDEIALRRILNVPSRGIGNATLEKYLALDSQDSLFERMKKAPSLAENRREVVSSFISIIHKYQEEFKKRTLAEALTLLIEELDYLNFIEKSYDNPKQIELRKNDVMRLIESANRFQNFYRDNTTLESFVEKLLLADSQAKETENEDPDVRKNEVTLMTFHSSKGLEFDVVFMVGVEEELLPHKKTVRDDQAEIEEERRLCYVGMTRAREKLVMTYAKERFFYGKKIPRHKSRFLANFPTGFYIEQDRTTFGHLSPEEASQYKSDFLNSLIDSLD